MVYVTSDLHGRMDCLEKLLDYVHFDEDEDNWLYILGDVIDRNNKGGVDILKWLLIQPNVQLILALPKSDKPRKTLSRRYGALWR